MRSEIDLMMVVIPHQNHGTKRPSGGDLWLSVISTVLSARQTAEVAKKCSGRNPNPSANPDHAPVPEQG